LPRSWVTASPYKSRLFLGTGIGYLDRA
jgi:hypothetical protein